MQIVPVSASTAEETAHQKQLLHGHYSAVFKKDKNRYTSNRWDDISKSADLACYKVHLEDGTCGWVFVDTPRSTILEMLFEGDYPVQESTTCLLDAIVALHKLVSAELPAEDTARHDLFIGYGFRPTRRFSLHGTPMVSMELSTAVYLEKLQGMRQPHYSHTEMVAIERVPKAQTEEQIRRGLEQLLEKLGGLRQFVKSGQTVVLKPNIVSDHGLRDGTVRGGIVTDVRVVSAMADLLQPVAGKIIIAEGSSINRSDTMKMFHHYGFDRIPARHPDKVSLVDLNADTAVEKAVPGGRRQHSRSIPKTLLDADVIINMPVLKLHFAAGVSLSIKNFQGAIPPLEKYKSHFYGLWQSLINTYKIIAPQLIIIDGLTGLEDFGPVSGSPVQMDLLIGGTNPVAVDTVAMKIMGLSIENAPHVYMACHEGLGPAGDDLIDIQGPDIASVSRPFKPPLHNLDSGACISIHNGSACNGCRGYLHFVLNKLRRPDPLHPGRLLINRPFDQNVNIFIGPETPAPLKAGETNIFMGICQQHHAETSGIHVPGCPPHTEEIINAVFGLFPDAERPKYADATEETKLREMLNAVLASHNKH